jgi:hypothetical protein
MNERDTGFSGTVRLLTVDGAVEVDIKEAEVRKGREILERSAQNPRRPKLELALKNLNDLVSARRKVRKYCPLPPFLKDEPTSRYDRWTKREYFRQIEEYGDEAVVTLIPTQLPDWTVIFNLLRRGDIYTKDDLANCSESDLADLESVGPFKLDILLAIRGVVVAQIEESSGEIVST